MTRTVEHIERDLSALQQSLSDLAQELHSAYGGYLTELGQAVRQQLILASYYLCTQGYPEHFLKLSLHQRQQLQQALQKIGQQGKQQLAQPLSQPNNSSEPILPRQPIGDEKAEAEAIANSLAEGGFTVVVESAEGIEEIIKASELALKKAELSHAQFLSDESGSTDEMTDEMDDGAMAELSAPDEQSDAIAPAQAEFTPFTVGRWHDEVEKAIETVLQRVSQSANQVLQQSKILSAKLPHPVLEVAAKAGVGTETAAGPPNLLNILVETESESNQSSVEQIMAIRLRLAEIEFNSPGLMAWRAKIRELMARLSQFKRDYQKKRRELAVAQAESAWRASWYDDHSD